MAAYVYAATVLSVHDGDSITVRLDLAQRMRGRDRDLGCHIYVVNHRLTKTTPIRLVGIDAAELGTPEGPSARDHLRTILPVGSLVRIVTLLDRTEKYGRLLGTVTIGDGVSANQQMLDDHYAVPYDGGQR